MQENTIKLIIEKVLGDFLLNPIGFFITFLAIGFIIWGVIYSQLKK